MARDDTGDNISRKNPSYCELTALYWAWKNLDADVVGLVHYRRYFARQDRSDGLNHLPMDNILAGRDAERLMEQYDIVVPRRQKYYIETLYSHYAHTHYPEHLDIAREIISEMYPEYLQAVDQEQKNQGKRIGEVRCIYTEKVNWGKKITSFLKAKFFGKKYEGSF